MVVFTWPETNAKQRRAAKNVNIAYSINFLFVLTIFEIFIAYRKAIHTHTLGNCWCLVAFACQWVKLAANKHSNNMAEKRLSRLAKNGKNDKCFTATKKVQPQTAKKFNFLAAEHDKHETIVALNKICKIITKPHTYI